MKQHTEKEEWQLKYVSKACKQASLLLQFFMLALAITNAFAKSEISTQIVWLNFPVSDLKDGQTSGWAVSGLETWCVEFIQY
jgi:hypothetical protein